ncbi:asialoglycoprotein receptor 2-like isoform X2 [Tachysurus fulvidraco]|uniref:asialoglycoprotein receptor 2-like isoform X2 n=1 Tax=Tachysurus fulvidraco TaxID=1234273 RepID=UPI000F508FB3|nr:asialoglycoprotein receptor 2-like isoform X2 [Tachysurus fulvidraco]
MTRNIYANCSAKYEDVYENDLPRTRVTRSNEGNKRSGVYRLAAMCVLLLFVLLLTAVIVLWVKLVTERNLNKKLKQERDQLQDLNMQDKLKWKRFGSSLYYFTDLKNWTESRQDCIERGADLVVINSKEKQDFIVNELQGSRKWIGLSDREEEGTWKWVDGTLLTNGHWGYSQPDNKENEDCAEIGLPERHNWNDRPCFEKQGWICEKRGDL